MPGVSSPPASRMAMEVAQQPATLLAAMARNHDALGVLRASLPGRVRLLGHGSSAHAARFGAMVLEARRQVQADVVPPPDVGGGVAVHLPGDLVIALSQSGETPTLVAAAARARRAGSRLVAVTNSPGSTLSRLSEVTLSCEAGVEEAVPATKSFLAQAALLLALAAGTEVVVELAGAVTALLADPPALVLRPRVIAGARAAAPIAGEVALKFAEAAGHGVVAVDAAEALHGAAAAGGVLLILAPGPDGNVEQLSAQPGAVTFIPGPGLKGTGDPDADALLLAVVGQLLALNLAAAEGRDPDRPPGMRKVTRSF